MSALGTAAPGAPPTGAASHDHDPPDLERRFGGLRRLYGEHGYARLRGAAFAVVGVGGVGSWAAEALARSGVARLVLVDLDHVAESNVNRQVQALDSTLGQAKVQALRERIAQIHPGCEVVAVEAFAEPDNWPGVLARPVDVVIDACDQVRAKRAIAAWALSREGGTVVCVGAAGGKCRPQALAVDDLADVTHDPLLSSLRQRLRRDGHAARRGPIGLRCVYSRETVHRPLTTDGEDCEVDGSLNCAGYGSSVMVTAAFGMAAAAEAVSMVLASQRRPARAASAAAGAGL